MGDQSITAYNPLPEQTANSDVVGLRVYRDDYNSGRDHTSETGKRQIGLVDVADANCELTPELDPVLAGAVQVPLEQLVTGYNGSASWGIQDLSMTGAEIANGTTLKVVDTEPDTPITATVAATGSDKTKIVVDDASTFVGQEGKCIRIPTADEATPLRGYIKRVVSNGTDTEEIYLVFPLDEVPFPTGTVKVLEGFEQDLGGNAMGLHEITMALDFGKGAKHRTVIHRARSTGGFKQTMAKGKVKTMLNMSIEGHAKTSGGRLQIVPISRYGTYGLATV